MKWIFLAGFTPSRGSLYAPSRLRRRAIFNPTHTSVSGSAIILFSEWNLMITKTIKRIGMIPTIALARARGDGSFWAGSRRPPQGPQHPPDSVRRFKVSFRIVRLQGGMRSRHFSLVLAAFAVFLGSRQRAAGRAAAGGAGAAGGIAVDVQKSGVRLRAEALEKVDLRARVQGFLRPRLFKDGDEVKKRPGRFHDREGAVRDRGRTAQGATCRRPGDARERRSAVAAHYGTRQGRQCHRSPSSTSALRSTVRPKPRS